MQRVNRPSVTTWEAFRHLHPFLPVALLIGYWVAVCSWRPLFLGFYHDDWSWIAVPVDKVSLAQMISTQPGRAVLAVVDWSLRHVLVTSEQWQGLASLATLANAYSLARLISVGVAGKERGIDWIGALSAILYMSFPWSLSFTAWPTMAVPSLAVAIFCGAGVLLLKRGRDTRAAVLASLLYLCGGVVYEAAWGAYVPLSLLALARERQQGESFTPVVWFFALSTVGQVVEVAFNLAVSGAAGARKVSSGIVTLFLHNLQTMPEGIAANFPKHLRLPLGCALVVLAAYVVLGAVRDRSSMPLVLVLAAALGLLTSCFLHAAVGYPIAWDDLMSRTSMMPSLWLTVVLALALQTARAEAIPIRIGAFVAALFLVVICTAQLARNMLEWGKGYQQQRELLSSFPVDQLDHVPTDALIAADVAPNANSRANFDAFWDISGGLYVSFRNSKWFDGTYRNLATVLRADEWWTRWDGKSLSQGWCRLNGVPNWSLPAAHLVLWRPSSRELKTQTPPVAFGCGGHPPEPKR